jgi:hypothetical protein
MPKILRHKTVSLDAGGWLDLKGCDVLWSSGTVKIEVLRVVGAEPAVSWRSVLRSHRRSRDSAKDRR